MRRVTWVLMLVAGALVARAGDNELSEQEKKDGWILLFDGKSMEGWQGKDGTPVNDANVKEGTFNTMKNNGGYVPVYAKRKFSDFVLALDFKVSKGCNSGVFFRVTDPKDPVQTGFEIQVFDSFGRKVSKHEMGALYDAQEPSKNASKPAGEWQHMEITAVGNKVKVVLNGETVNEADLDRWTQAEKNPDGTKNKFKTALKDMAKEGYIGLQDHGHDCWFKNIKVKVIGN